MKAQIWSLNGYISQTDPGILTQNFTSLLEQSGFSIIGTLAHHFDPQGFTIMFLLGESHFAIHTFPEEGQSYYELSSCVQGPFIAFAGAFFSSENCK